jgi:ElaB/YqjD/DUF883 family membrane-anchored ribosome-binding protein
MEQNDFSAERPATGSTGNGSVGTTDADFGRTSSTTPEGSALKDRARDIAGTAQERLADVGSTVRERAGTAKDSLADALESGAEKIRSRTTTHRGQLAGATDAGSVAVDETRVAVVGEKVAGGMQATADWLRDADLDGLKAGVERQVKEHPGRTLAIAVGLGYLIGKAFRK